MVLEQWKPEPYTVALEKKIRRSLPPSEAQHFILYQR